MINPGTFDLRYREPEENGTLIVTGMAKSGTSMVAAALAAFGVPMGQSWAPGVFEDQEFDHQFKYYPFDVPRDLVQARNDAYALWGFKHPELYDRLGPAQLWMFRSPRLIVITRDLTACVRHYMLTEPDAAKLINETCWKQVRLMTFVQSATCPTLMLSYEKFLAFPENSLRQLTAFCGIAALPAEIAEVAAGVVGENAAYLKTFEAEVA